MWALACSTGGRAGGSSVIFARIWKFWVIWMARDWVKKISVCRMKEATNVHRKQRRVMLRWGSGRLEKMSLSVLQRSVLRRRGHMPSFLFACAEKGLGRPKTIISQFQTLAMNWVPELTARVLLPTTDPLISDSARSPPATRPPNSSKTRFFFASQSRWLRSSKTR